MPNFQPIIEIDRTVAFLEQRMHGPVTEIEPIDQGQLSRVYAFIFEGEPYIIRFNDGVGGYERDRDAYQRLSQHGIPAPRVTDLGQVDGLSYAISERVPGRTLLRDPHEIHPGVLRQLVELAVRLHTLDMTNSRGWGWIDDHEMAGFPSWSKYLKGMFAEYQNGFWSDWFGLFDGSCLESDVFWKIHDRMMKLATFGEQHRALCHGDFHAGNMLSDGRRITGIVDWGNMRYGDGLLDVATYHMWSPEHRLPDLYKESCEAHNIPLPNFNERFLCATLCLGLDALRFFAKSNETRAYRDMRDYLLSLAL